jgi:hypothetical protein
MTNDEIAAEMISTHDEGHDTTPDIPLRVLKISGEMIDCTKDYTYIEKVRQTWIRRVLPLLQRAREEGAREATAHNLPGAPMTEEEVDLVEKNTDAYRHALVESRLVSLEEIETFLKIISQIRWLNERIRDMAQDQPGDIYRAAYAAAVENYWKDLIEEARENVAKNEPA